MSRFKQYLFFGGLLFIFQSRLVKGVFQSPAFLNTVLGMIVFLLIVAVVVTYYAKKRL